uniref:LAGLIDADG endonuclease n=1 Tax=Peronospora matthiolae TaxID=2874970 RepID=A0AAV1UE01_9STRA
MGSLLWISRCTRPDICFVGHKATRQTHKPTTKDWKTAKRITRDLKMSKDLKLHLGGDVSASKDILVECWSDAELAVDKSKSSSIAGCILTMDKSVILWLCKKQSGVSLSTMEAEFIAASQAGRELLGMKGLLDELELSVIKTMPMWMNNQAAIKQIDSERSTSSAMHVNIRFELICNHSKEGIVAPRFVKYQDMMADILTKSLPAPRMEELRAMFGLKTTQDETEEEC